MADLISQNFEDRLMDYKVSCEVIGKGLQQYEEEPRPRWMLVSLDSITTTTADGTSSGTPSITDIDIIKQTFDRSLSEELYADALDEDNEEAFVEQMALATNQSDMLAGMQRDFLLRHRSRIRQMAVEATNKQGMGSDNGAIQAGVLEWANAEALRLSRENGNDS